MATFLWTTHFHWSENNERALGRQMTSYFWFYLFCYFGNSSYKLLWHIRKLMSVVYVIYSLDAQWIYISVYVNEWHLRWARTHEQSTHVKIVILTNARNQYQNSVQQDTHRSFIASVEFQQNERHLHNGNNEFSKTINAIGRIDETVAHTIAKVQLTYIIQCTCCVRSNRIKMETISKAFVLYATANITALIFLFTFVVPSNWRFHLFVLHLVWIFHSSVEEISPVRKIKRQHQPMNQPNWKRNYKAKWKRWPVKWINWLRKMMRFWWAHTTMRQ